jgi:aminopeptidase N
VAVSDYTTLKDTYQGDYNPVPIELAAQTADTTRLQQSFKNLKQAIKAYEYWYGPHRFNKVGYSLVPFNSGAMEHATNIAYPIYAANGTLRWESLMAHELGHSWWGNNVTCLTGQDMWINEGMASYSVHLFYEQVYGQRRYIQEVKKNHINVLLNAHKTEGTYRPISGVPFEYTYGTHVYKKGAVVAHNLRTYLGDSLFRVGLQHIQEKFKFQSITSVQMRDELSIATQVNLTPFFDDWVFTAGYPDFCIQEYSLLDDMLLFKANQYLVGRTTKHTQVPLEVTLWSKDWQKHTTQVIANPNVNVAIPAPFEPVAVILNQSHQLNQGSIDFEVIANQSNKNNLSYPTTLGIKHLEIKQLKDSALLHIKYHLGKIDTTGFGSTAPDTIGFWSINGIFPDSFKSIINFKEVSPDFDVLYYKPFDGRKWQEASKKEGHYEMKKGLYCWGNTSTSNSVNINSTSASMSGGDSPIPFHCSINGNRLSIISSQLEKDFIYIEMHNAADKKIKCQKVRFKDGKAKVKIPKKAIKALLQDKNRTTIQIYSWSR